MKILMANKYLYPRAGAETYMLTVADQLRARGHTVGFFGMDHAERPREWPSWTVPPVELGPRLSPVTRAKEMSALAVRSLRGLARRTLAKAVAEFQPDLVHAHNIYNQLSPGIFECCYQDVPVIMTAHDYKPICPSYGLFTNGGTCTRCIDQKKAYWNCVKHRCCHGRFGSSIVSAISANYHDLKSTYQRLYRSFIAPSEFMGKCLTDGGIPEERVVVINNFAEVPMKATPPGEGLLYAGRLCVEKGVDTLIRAYAKLDSPRPPLRIAGDGPIAAELQALSVRHSLENEVTWLGRVKPNEVARELERCAVAVIPSLWFENCSMAIMESLAAGRPCLVSDSGGNPELVEDKMSGWVFQAGQVASLHGVLKSIQQTSRERICEMGLAARQQAQERFSPEVHLKQVESVYARVTS